MESGIYSDGKRLLLFFGGKIGVSAGTMTSKEGCREKHTFVSFQELQDEYAVGENLLGKVPLSDDSIFLCFDDVSQVDVVIKALERAKERLKGKE